MTGSWSLMYPFLIQKLGLQVQTGFFLSLSLFLSIRNSFFLILIVESSDKLKQNSLWRLLTKHGPLEKGMLKTTSAFLPWEPHEQYEKGKRYNTERWTLQVGRYPYATGKEKRNDSRMKEETEPKWKQHPVVDMTGDGSRVRCWKNNTA